MKINQIVESATVAGSIATVAAPLGATQARSQKPPKSPKVAKAKKYANVISEGKMKEIAYDLEHLDAGNFKKKYGKTKEEFKASLKEEKIEEADLIVVPGMRRMKDKSFIPHKEDRRDHEVEMARSDLYAAAKDAMRIFKLLKDRSEDEGIMGWQQSYITLAADYLNSVADSLEYQMNMYEMTAGVIAGGMSNFEEDSINEISDFKKKELEYELRNEPKNNYQVSIDGKGWKVFADKAHAEAVARKIRAKGKKAEVHITGASVSESSESATDKIRDRLGTTGKLQRMMDRHEAWMDAHNQQALSRMSDEERYHAAKTQYDIDFLAHRLERMKKDDADWEKTFNMLRDRINRYQWTTQQDVDPEKLEKISNIKYQSTKEGIERAVDKKGRTQQDWIKAVKQKYPDAKIVQSKMIDGPVHALLPNNKKLSWTKDGSEDIAEGKKHECPECGGEMVSEELMNEKKDACYYKVKSRYKVWPSAYASGALVKCRKKGASNWGNKSKK